jgi:multimeric flavodoxin WrbA/putative sterol carrier protein
MKEQAVIVAVNGSPHAALGNAAIMIEMLRPTLLRENFQLEVINLAYHNIEYCKGCAFCMEKGACWIDDDHRHIVNRLLNAAGVILASPVFFMSVTGQMKTFLDRCLALGHKPQSSWKPGLAISVSAGMGETETAQYLAFLLRTFGAYPVGTFTALATQPGQFLGQPIVEARAQDLARDLARAIREKRRYPATDSDLRYYQFMSYLVKSQKETIMKDDDRHWQKQGFYQGFESYIQQKSTTVSFDPELRNTLIKEMMDEQKERKKAPTAEVKKPAPEPPAPAGSTCRDLLRMMPGGLNPAEAKGLKAIFQFEISGSENFTAHLRIADGKCSHHEGAADKPDVVIKAPADIWQKISRGELSGQKAFMEGKYRVEGNIMLLRRLKNLFTD